MKAYKKISKIQITALALTMVMAGGGAFGVMSAANNASAQTPSVVSADSQQHRKNETPLNGSIRVDPETKDESLSEAEEDAQYVGLATITEAEAKRAAETKVGGTASRFKLGNEKGSLIYEVEIGNQEVKVDAGDGTVLEVESGNHGHHDENDGIEDASEGPEDPTDDVVTN